MPIDTNYSYNDQSGRITITKYKTVIHMTVGSTKATVNGKTALMPVAPMKIKYVAADKMKILIPSRFVSEALGLSYTWYSGTNTVAIVKNSLELSLNGGPKYEYTGSQGKVTIDGESIDVNDTPSIIIDDTAMLNASRVFAESKN
jgi:N-acetylmuramoyl-L-alanine amidase